MKANSLFNKAIYLLAVISLISLSANSAFSQQAKKKIVRVIESDDKGEHVVKEYNVTNDAAKFDSITHDINKKMKVEQFKMDSLAHILMKNMPPRPEFPPMPEFPDMSDLDIGIDMPEAPFFDPDNDFEFFINDSIVNSPKIYYSEKNLDNSGDLTKILEDLEKGTFDPQKWNMKEVEKDKLKDFKTKGKGEVLVFENPVTVNPRINHFYRSPRRNVVRIREPRGDRNRHRMIYMNDDSLKNKNFETFTIESSGNADKDLCEKLMILSSDGGNTISMNGDQIIYSTDSTKGSGEKVKTFTIKSDVDSDEPNCKKVIVISSDGKKSNVKVETDGEKVNEKRMIVMVSGDKATKIEFTRPTVGEMKMLEKSDLVKEDKAKLLSNESLMFLPQKEKDKYKISFKEKESGKVKFVITDEKGKAIKTEEFDHSKGKTEKEVEVKDLKTGTYFIQAQLNGKTTTSKMQIKVE